MADSLDTDHLTQRQNLLFRDLLELYARQQKPVASHQLQRRGISSATVRAETAALVRAGLVQRVSRNRGAVPTVEGWARYLADDRRDQMTLRDAKLPLLARQESVSQAAHREASDLADKLGGAVMVRYPQMGTYRIRDLHVVQHGWAMPPLMMLYANGVQATADPLTSDPARLDRDVACLVQQLEPELRSMAQGQTVHEFRRALQQSGGRMPALGHNSSANQRGMRWLAALCVSLTDLIRRQKTLWEVLDVAGLPDQPYTHLVQIVLDRQKHPGHTEEWWRSDGKPVLIGRWEHRYDGLMYVGIRWGQGFAPTGTIGFLGPVVPQVQAIVNQLTVAGERLRHRFYQPCPV